jgi:hypothetical protein
VPAQNGLGAYEQRSPSFLWKHARGGGKQGAVVRPEVWPLHLAAEDVELVAENQDLDLLCFFRAQRQHGELEKATQRPVAERQNDEMGFRLHGRGRLRHLTSSAARADPQHLITGRTEFPAPTPCRGSSPSGCLRRPRSSRPSHSGGDQDGSVNSLLTRTGSTDE